LRRQGRRGCRPPGRRHRPGGRRAQGQRPRGLRGRGRRQDRAVRRDRLPPHLPPGARPARPRPPGADLRPGPVAAVVGPAGSTAPRRGSGTFERDRPRAGRSRSAFPPPDNSRGFPHGSRNLGTTRRTTARSRTSAGVRGVPTAFLTISTTGVPERPATDRGFLLHKHPDKAQSFSTCCGRAHVFYPEADEARCTVALLLEVDTVALVRRGKGKGRGGAPDAALAQYVNDRPYAASSLLAVALGNVFSSALRGVCDARPEQPALPRPLRVEVPALPARGGPALVHRLFEPLGWTVTADPVALDTEFPEWGDSRYVRLVLESETLTLAEALRHLYVLLPVLDDAKHYWVAPDEVDKLLR